MLRKHLWLKMLKHYENSIKRNDQITEYRKGVCSRLNLPNVCCDQ